MKKLAFCLVALAVMALVGTIWAGEDKPEPQVRLELDLTDGSRVMGVPGIASVPVQTSYAKMDILFKQILTIRIDGNHETASLDLRNGDKLKGVLTLAPVKLETVFGKVAISVEHIRTFRVVLSLGALPDSLKHGLVLHYSFDRDEKSKVTDESGKGNVGEVKGAKWTPNGKTGGAYDFDGHDDYIDAPDHNLPTGNPIVSVSAWIKTTQSGEEYVLAWGSRPSPAHGDLMLGIRNNHLCVGSNGEGWEGNTVVNDGRWHSLVAVWRRGDITAYVDGNSQTLAFLGKRGNINIVSSGHTNVGRLVQTDGYYFKGSIDDVMIFDRALSEAEVKQIYDAQK